MVPDIACQSAVRQQDRHDAAGSCGVAPGRAPLPIEHVEGVFIVGPEVLVEPAHAPQPRYLPALAPPDGGGSSFPAAIELAVP